MKLSTNISHIILKSLIMALSLLTGSSLFAQQLYFCDGYSNNGEPKNAKEEWKLGEKGTKIDLLYNNGKTTIDNAKLFFLVEEKANPTKTRKLEVNVNQQRNWVATNFTFDHAGQFMVTVYNADNVALISKKIEITDDKPAIIGVNEAAKPKETAPVDKIRNDELASIQDQPAVTKTTFTAEEMEKVHYYDNSRLFFGDRFTDGNLDNPRTNFKMAKNGVYVEMLLVTPKPATAEKLLLDVWKKTGDKEYTEHVGEKTIDTKPGEKMSNFHYSFLEPGEYKISIFSADNTWICSGYLTVGK